MYVAKPLSRRYYARGARYSRASALPRAHRRFVACNGHVHPPKSNVCLAPGYIWPSGRYIHLSRAYVGRPQIPSCFLNVKYGSPARSRAGESFEDLLYGNTGGNAVALWIPVVYSHYVLCTNTYSDQSPWIFPGFCDRLRANTGFFSRWRAFSNKNSLANEGVYFNVFISMYMRIFVCLKVKSLRLKLSYASCLIMG